jgi:hypothetical protein
MDFDGQTYDPIKRIGAPFDRLQNEAGINSAGTARNEGGPHFSLYPAGGAPSV